MENFKHIHIGQLLKQKVDESDIDIYRICNFFHCESTKIQQMYDSEGIDVLDLLRWSKLLEYDFFRLYSQHIILYAPPKGNLLSIKSSKSKMPTFRKNIYTIELIDFIIELVNTGKKTKQEIIDQYNIPKTTLYKWLEKYNEKKY